MKRKYREAMRAAARERDRQPDDDDEAIEARDWHDEWARAHHMPEQAADFQTEMTN